MKSLNPSHPDCECEQCQEMLRRAREIKKLKNEFWQPYYEVCLVFEQVIDQCFAHLTSGTLPPKDVVDRLKAAKSERDIAYALYQKNTKVAYEKYPITHHA